jgi:hypothetical protein
MEFKKYNKTVQVNNVDVAIEITVKVEDESDWTILLDQDFETPRHRQDFINKLETEQLFSGYIEVEATASGLSGFDSMGGCELIPNNMFNSEPFTTSVDTYLNEYAMEGNAISELIRQLTDAYTELTEQAQIFKPFAK